MNKFFTSALILAAAAFQASADTEVFVVSLNDGTTQEFRVDQIKEMTFGTRTESTIAGYYYGTNSVVVGGQFTYNVEVGNTITENADGTINVAIPEYKIPATVMGDLTLGAVEIKNIAFDKDKNAYYRMYSGDGLTQHFKAEKDGNVTMDKDYNFTEGSYIQIALNENKSVTVVNSFKLGAMPFPIVATLLGEKTEAPKAE